MHERYMHFGCVTQFAAKGEKAATGRADVALAMLYKIEVALQIELRRLDFDQAAAPEGVTERYA